MRSTRITVVVVALAVVLAACSGSESSPDTTQETSVSTVLGTDTTSTTPAGESVLPAGQGTTTTVTVPEDDGPSTTEPAAMPVRTDLLTFAQGVLFVEQTGLATGSASTALEVIDGGIQLRTITSDAQPAVEFIYKMPANTTFDLFAIPNVLETPGNVTFIKSVTISGSLEGVTSGFQVLASVDLETHASEGEYTEFAPDVVTPVRWVKVNLEGGINIEAGDVGRTNLEFTEIIGNGTQDARALSTAFTGIWDLKLTGRLDLRGKPLELQQNGTTISGCLDTIIINGTVNGPIARATGVDPARNDRPSAFIFVADEDGSIQAVMSENNSLFNARTAVVDPDVTSTPCSDAPPEPQFCAVPVYVNFDVNSAVIRPESAQVLDDLYAGLTADGATQLVIEGHTSTEGSAEDNLDLSERRAQAVVDGLIARGIAATNISAIGKGETEPLLSPDNDETSRSLNRRVEIDCG